jgi:hypothetical protein
LIHYHGTPLTPRSEMMKMAGKHFCVSYANPSDADWCAANGQSVMWDNGAFSMRDKKTSFDPAAFAVWVGPRLGHPHWCVIPDVIGGEVEDQRATSAGWSHPPELSAPVWHMGLPIDWLLELADGWPRLCFGSSHQFWQVGSDAWCRKADDAFNALAKRGTLPWVHLLRGLSLCGDQWPFASADSCNVALNFKGDKRTGRGAICPERMARRIDAIQCPITWEIHPEQKGLFDVA